MSPNQREGLTAISSITGLNEYILSTGGALNIAGSFSVTGGATSANQTNGQQLVQIVDAGGEAATVTGGKLDVNATASLAGTAIPISGATTAVGVAIVDGSGNQITSFGGGTQYTDAGTPPAHPIGPTLEFNNAGTWATVGSATPLPVTATFSPSGTQDINLKQINGNTTSVGNGVAGTGVQRVTIASDNTAFAVNATLSAETTKVIGTVNQGTSPWVVSNSVLSVIGNGAAATAQRVTLANDSTGIIATVGAVTSITNALPAGTNVIGHVITDTGSTTAVTGNVSVTQNTSPWIVAGGGTAGTAATGVVSIQGIASMTPVQVSQAAAANLNATVVGTGTFVVQATLAAETTKVIGTVNQGTSPWVTSNTTTSVVGNGAAATAQRVTLANDSTGIIATVGAVTAITNALPAGTNAIGKLSANGGVIIGDVNVVSDIPGVAATSLGKAEDAAHTTGDTGVFALGVRNDTLASTTNTTADYTQLSTDQAGIVITAGAPRTLKANQVTTITSSTGETTIATAVASTFLDLYGILITNTSATAVNVQIKDGTAGTTRLTIAIPATETRGYMLPLDSAIKQSATNANWTATSSASVASLVITALTVARV